MVLPYDWQTTKQKVAQRSQYLLEMGQWSDCKFIVGQEPNQQILEGHKVFLAMSSPVFEAMFFGGMAEKSDPIPIRDVQPEAFKALLEYIYTDKVDLGSFELACELCYCAKKYMLPFLVKECTKFLWSDLSPKKACRAYEFARLFEEPVLMDKCLQIMRTRTNEVIGESSWDDVELETVVTIFEQDKLHVSSELDLFNALEKWARAECLRKSLDLLDQKLLKVVVGNALTQIRFLTLTPREFAEGPGNSSLLTQQEAFAVLMNISSPNSDEPMPEGFCTTTQSRATLIKEQAFGHSEFAMKLLQPYTPIIKWSSSDLEERPINLVGSTFCRPLSVEGDCTVQKNPMGLINNGPNSPKFYCVRPINEETVVYNDTIMDSTVTFTVDKNICVLGLKVPSQCLFEQNNVGPLITSYTETLFAQLLDFYDTQLTYTDFCAEVNVEDLIEVTFNRPVYVQKNKLYKIGVVFNRKGWYPLARCTRHNMVYCKHYNTWESLSFAFNHGGL